MLWSSIYKQLLVSLLSLSAAASARLLCDPPHATYDYVIVGGGTAGLAVANRLSANPDISVAVIEAGRSQLDNASIAQTANYFTSFFTDVDWAYPSSPQIFSGDRSLVYSSGRALGGTSTINGATYIRAEKAQIDAWGQLGNDGWDWETLWPYYLKSEKFFEPPADQLEATGFTFEEDLHSDIGYVGVGIINITMQNNAHDVLNATTQALGIPWNQDMNGGDIRGFSLFPSTVDGNISIRADAARSYYQPIKERQNLHLYLNTIADRLLLDEDVEGDSLATGVVVHEVNETQTTIIRASREIVLSAGSLKSPIILENSGVGNPQLLNVMGIPVQIALPTVGENLQDQPNSQIIIAANTTYTGYTPFVVFVTAEDLFGDNTTAVSVDIASSIPSYAQKIDDESNYAYPQGAVQRQLEIQADLIFNQSVPVAEILLIPLETAFLGVFWGMLPFSRGSVHLSSSKASSWGPEPRINPNFFMLEWDELLQVATARKVREIAGQAPLADLLGQEITPNTTTVPVDADVATWSKFLKANFNSNYHPVGTCAMMSRELGGVVDANLKVYGTKNVRVVDASVLPFQVDAHLTSTIYAVAERASDLILASYDSRTA
ncbi:choline dehydrogenase [Elsinoe ampelina]|uniref:Choline dehydrogenase n=1 Tax=Elsinoe ampelina TaxID=302913 RepID=A0A6A6GAU6_9PEZI|nr:choline dehydrogenase [Elsinoe ampelina]